MCRTSLLAHAGRSIPAQRRPPLASADSTCRSPSTTQSRASCAPASATRAATATGTRPGRHRRTRASAPARTRTPRRSVSTSTRRSSPTASWFAASHPTHACSACAPSPPTPRSTSSGGGRRGSPSGHTPARRRRQRGRRSRRRARKGWFLSCPRARGTMRRSTTSTFWRRTSRSPRGVPRPTTTAGAIWAVQGRLGGSRAGEQLRARRRQRSAVGHTGAVGHAQRGAAHSHTSE
mmetsp:Transcript_5111/g.16836  ORF Transcript_5111/g.16836 Transcript_5111/m.16836 type:complete len:235 (-) Transcript_5111:151-855(-)